MSRTKQPPFNPAAAVAIMKADVAKLPDYVGIELPGQGYGVYRINKVTQAQAPDAARRKTELDQIAGALGQQDMYGYIQAVKQKAKVKLLTRPVGQAPSQ